MDDRQESVDRFYMQNGPCCAGCDWWRHYNSSVGDCTLSPPVGSEERSAMIGISNASIAPGAGHVMTLRDHKCGSFKDGFDWSTLPLAYLKKIEQFAYLKGRG